MDVLLEQKDLEISIPEKEEVSKIQILLQISSELSQVLLKNHQRPQDALILLCQITNFLEDLS